MPSAWVYKICFTNHGDNHAERIGTAMRRSAGMAAVFFRLVIALLFFAGILLLENLYFPLFSLQSLYGEVAYRSALFKIAEV